MEEEAHEELDTRCTTTSPASVNRSNRFHWTSSRRGGEEEREGPMCLFRCTGGFLGSVAGFSDPLAAPSTGAEGKLASDMIELLNLQIVIPPPPPPLVLRLFVTVPSTSSALHLLRDI